MLLPAMEGVVIYLQVWKKPLPSNVFPGLSILPVLLVVLFACGLHYYLLNTLENAHQLARQLGDVCVVAHTHTHTHIHAAIL